MNILDKICQAVIDSVVGIAIFFVMVALLPKFSMYLVALLALVVTALFAEFFEIRIKK